MLVAVSAVGMAPLSIHTAPTSAGGVPDSSRPPARTFGGPAHLRLTHAALDPVTAHLLLHNDLALGTLHGLALCEHVLIEIIIIHLIGIRLIGISGSD